MTVRCLPRWPVNPVRSSRGGAMAALKPNALSAVAAERRPVRITTVRCSSLAARSSSPHT